MADANVDRPGPSQFMSISSRAIEQMSTEQLRLVLICHLRRSWSLRGTLAMLRVAQKLLSRSESRMQQGNGSVLLLSLNGSLANNRLLHSS